MRSVCALMVLAVSVAVAQDAPQYALQLAADGSSVDVRLCMAQARETMLFAADSPDAMKFIASVARSTGKPVDKEADGWSAKNWQADECLSYRADLDAISASNNTDVGFRLGD